MRFAIVESGGKQYRAVEGRTIEVDRLPVDTGNKFDFERVLLMADGDDILVGTPTISDILVKVTVVDHIKGPKIDRFKYRPKKRIRVRGGHRQQYTRLLIDFIGRPDEERKAEEKPEKMVEAEIEKILSDAGLKMMDATTWPQQAKLAAQGDWEALEKLQNKLSGGRKVSAEKKPVAKKTSKK
jgi:large subunit ribosomal protein L21